jgi:pimeloyl-ACP methyl ester carboxylesterase
MAAWAIARGTPNAPLVEFEGSDHFTFSDEPELFLEMVNAPKGIARFDRHQLIRNDSLRYKRSFIAECRNSAATRT